MGNVNNAGLGLDFNVNGLEALQSTMNKLQEIQKSIQALNKVNEIKFKVSVTNTDAVKKVVDQVNKIKKSKMNIKVNADGSAVTKLSEKVKNATNKIGNDSKNAAQNISKISASFNKVIPAIQGVYSPLDSFKLKFNNASYEADNSTRKNIDSVRKLADSIGNLAQPIGIFKKISNETTENSSRFERLRGSISKLSPPVAAFKSLFGRASIDVDADTNRSVSRFDRFRSVLGKLSSPVKSFSSLFHRQSEDVDKDTERTSSRIGRLREKLHSLSTIAGGNLIATGISSGLGAARNFVSGAANMAAGGQQTAQTWKSAGLGNSQAAAMSAQLADIRGKSDMAGASITAMQRQFLTLTGSATQARALTDSMAAFGSASGRTGEQIQATSGQLGRLFSSSKVRAQMFNRTLGQMPGMVSEIAKVSGHTTDGFKKIVASGKLTGAQLEKYFIEASKHSGAAWDAYGKTYKGVMASIKGTYQNMMGAFGKPMLASFTKELSSLGKSQKGLGNVKKQLIGISTEMGKTVGNVLGKALGFLIQNAKPLGSIIKSLMTITKLLVSGAWSVFSGVLKLISGQSDKAKSGLNGTASALKSLASHTTAIKVLGGTLVTIFAVTKAVKFASVIYDVAKNLRIFTAAQWLLNAAMDANPIGIAVIAISALVAAAVLLYKKCKPFRDFINGLGKDIKKLFGGIGNWAKNVASSVGKTFTSIKQHTGKLFKATFADVKKTSEAGVKYQKSKMVVFRDIFTGNFKKLKKDVPNLFKNMFNLLKSIGKTSFNFLNRLTGGRLGEMIKAFKTGLGDIGKVWRNSWNSIGNFFSGIWKWIKKLTASGINDVIGVINAGISGIDWVISKFGGSSNAIGKISYVKYATGTGAFSGQRRAITRPTMAMLNDGNDSPETGNREMILHANGESELVKGRNTLRMLEPHAEVLNASETKALLSRVPRFAKGTGFFSGIVKGVENGVSSAVDWTANAYNSIKDKLKLIEQIIKHPTNYLSSLFKSPSKQKGDIENDLVTGFFNKTTSAASGWWNQLMSMISSTLDDSGGSASGLLAAVEKYGHGKRYVWGAHGPDTFDCSGLVQYALEKAFGISLPAPSGNQIRNTQHISASEAQPGDLIGNDGHIGVYAGHGKYYSAESPDNHPNIGMGDIRYFPHGAYQFGRVRGLAAKTKKTKHGKANSSIQRLIKQETGGMLGWIAKHLAPLLDAGGDGNSPKGHMSRAKFDSIARQAASITHTRLSGSDLAKLYHQAYVESNVDPSTGGGINDHDGTGLPYGLFQYKRSTWDSYALPGHKNMQSALDQLVTVMNDKNWPSDIPDVNTKRGWSPTGGRKMEIGGHIAKGEIAQVHEKGFELFRPDVSGSILPHHDAKRALSGHDSIKINSPITINGNADKHTVDDLDKVLEQRNNQLIDKMNTVTGRDREGGIII